jgi:hypothetical protein
MFSPKKLISSVSVLLLHCSEVKLKSNVDKHHLPGYSDNFVPYCGFHFNAFYLTKTGSGRRQSPYAVE